MSVSNNMSYQRDIKPHKCAGAVSQISQIVVPVVHVVLNDHMSLADAGVHRGDDEVIKNFSTRVSLLRANNGTAVALVSSGAHQAASIYVQSCVLGDCEAFNNLSLSSCIISTNFGLPQFSVERPFEFLPAARGPRRWANQGQPVPSSN